MKGNFHPKLEDEKYILTIYMLMSSILCASDQLNMMLEALKTTEIKLDLNQVDSRQYWGWILQNITDITYSQVDWGSRKKVDFSLISSISMDNKVSINSKMKLLDAIRYGLINFDCTAIFTESKIIIIPKEVSIDLSKYKEISNLMYRLNND